MSQLRKDRDFPKETTTSKRVFTPHEKIHDLDLERVIDEMRKTCLRVDHGEVICKIGRHARLTIYSEVRTNRDLPEDIERAMTTPPRGRR